MEETALRDTGYRFYHSIQINCTHNLSSSFCPSVISF